jgi:SAM-dependent methyltransferase
MNDAGPSRSFFDTAYRANAPWDVGQPQPALTDLIEEFPPFGPILDLGCGTGDLCLFLAERGFPVIGIDLAEAAITSARSKASTATEPAVRERMDFRVGDALRFDTIPDVVRTIMDSGFFHLFGAEDRHAFVEHLADKLPVGGRYYVLGFAFQAPVANAPREVRAEELRALFAPERGWQILSLRPAEFLTVSGNVPAVAACIERTRLGEA